METKINIAKILKNKPEGTKLWTDMFGSVTLYIVTNVCDAFQVKHHNKEPWFDEDGKLYEEGVLCIYPSKSMRDWSKFAWKKGDVLIRTNSEYCIGIFDEWTSDDYSTFSAKYINLGLSDNFSCSYTCKTEEWEKTENSKSYISEIERVMNGKLNLQTLEIQTQPEFKDGDIVLVESHMIGINTGSMIAIFRKEKEIDKYKFSPALCESIEHDTYLREDPVVLSPSDIKIFRPATDSEKQQLFDALAKEGKSWDAEKKKIIASKQKWTPKLFEKIIALDPTKKIWTIDFFIYKFHGRYFGLSGYYWDECLPYNDETAKLIGTTNNVRRNSGWQCGNVWDRESISVPTEKEISDIKEENFRKKLIYAIRSFDFKRLSTNELKQVYNIVKDKE